jgi:hypothetical protein
MFAKIEIILDTWPELVLFGAVGFGLIFLAKKLHSKHDIYWKKDKDDDALG